VKLDRRLFRFECRVDALGTLIAGFDHGGVLNQVDRYVVERSLIQLQIEWEQFVRNFILDCATGLYFDSSGHVTSSIGANPRNREQAAHLLVSLYPNRRFEPDWYLPRDAIDAAGRLGLSNAGNVAAQLGISPWAIDDLRHVRNFIAHRSKRSALNMRNAGLSSSSGRIDPVATAFGHAASGAKRYIEWSGFVKYVASMLVR